MGTVKCVGILTSGGDAPGMNAAIRAVTRAAIYNGLQVKGIYRGYKGLVTGEISEFKSQNVSNIIQLGGTILKTARCKEFTTPEGRQLAYENMKKEGIDALVIIGGDGSLTGARIFAQEFDAAPVFPAEVIQVHLAQQRGVLGYIDGKVVRVDLQMAVRPFKIIHLFRLAEKLHQIIPFMDEVDGDAAAHVLVGGIHGAVIHAGPPAGQVGRAQHPGRIHRQRRQRLLEGQHRAAPAHGGGHIGLLPRGQAVRKGPVRAFKDRLFYKKSIRFAPQIL